jgi:death-on-curing family protein
MMQKITVKIVEHIAVQLSQEMLEFDEPIPDFATRYPNRLESCLATPFQTFAKKSLYSSLVSKASILFYLMIKNHPFQNGNKRIATTTLMVFLFLNKKWTKLKNEVVKAIEKFIKTYWIKIEDMIDEIKDDEDIKDVPFEELRVKGGKRG